jgi:hypothetical protein
MFLRCQVNRKLKDRQLGPFTLLEKIGANNCKLEMPYIVRLHQVFHVNNIRLCLTMTLHSSVHVTTHDDDDDEYDLDRMSFVKTDIVPRCRGKYMLFYTHFKDEQIPHAYWHCLNEVQRTITLPYILDSPYWLDFACLQGYLDFMRTSHPVRLPHSHRLHQRSLKTHCNCLEAD